MKVGFTKDKVVRGVFDMERLMLKKDEVARVALLDSEVDCEIVHSVWVEEKNDVNGYYVCLGDREKMAASKTEIEPDPDNCPFCAACLNSDVVKPPRYRFAANLFRYITTSKGEILGGDVNGMVQAWIFTQDKYNDIVAKQEEWKDLRQYDLKFTCESAQYQSMKIDVCAAALWRKDEATAKKVLEIFKAEKQKELFRLLGRKVDASRMRLLISKFSLGTIAQEAKNAEIETTDMPQVSADALLNGISEEKKEPKEEPKPEKQVEVNFDLLNF